jgi:multicomponent Na+:H+ antiporter subunit E
MENEIVENGEKYVEVWKRDIIIGILALFCFWLLLTFDLSYFSLGLGLAISTAIMLTTRKLVITEVKERRKTLKEYFLATEHLIGIIFTTLSRVIYGNLLLMYQALTLKINPKIVKVKVSLGSDLELALISSLITLSPGSIVVDIEDAEDVCSYLYIHFSHLKVKDIEEDAKRKIGKLDNLMGALFK